MAWQSPASAVKRPVMTKKAAQGRKQIVLRPIPAGAEISLEVEGGYILRTAPEDGVSIETEDRNIFVPARMLHEVLTKLGHEVLAPATASPAVRGPRTRATKPAK